MFQIKTRINFWWTPAGRFLTFPFALWLSLFLAQVWISYAKFELSIDGPDRLQRCRQIFEEANKGMRSCEEKEERLMLLESWKDLEKEFGSEGTVESQKAAAREGEEEEEADGRGRGKNMMSNYMQQSVDCSRSCSVLLAVRTFFTPNTRKSNFLRSSYSLSKCSSKNVVRR